MPGFQLIHEIFQLLVGADGIGTYDYFLHPLKCSEATFRVRVLTCIGPALRHGGLHGAAVAEEHRQRPILQLRRPSSAQAQDVLDPTSGAFSEFPLLDPNNIMKFV